MDPKFEPYHPSNDTAAAAIAAAAVPAMTYVAGDKDLTQTATDFVSKWFVPGKSPEAFQHLSSRAHACVNQYRDEGTPAPKSPAEARQLAQEGKKSTAAFVGNVKKLDDAIVAPVVSHPDVQLVKHANSRRSSSRLFQTTWPPPQTVRVESLERKFTLKKPTTGNVYGNYYATRRMATRFPVVT